MENADTAWPLAKKIPFIARIYMSQYKQKSS